jgi:CubicO group peptidase (beta-lactamase class C family)
MNRRTMLAISCALLFQAGSAVSATTGHSDAVVREISDGRMDAIAREAVAKEHFTGVVLVMQRGRILHARGYGLASAHRANSFDTKFHVGSITKEFTATAIMQLAEQGALRLDGRINAYLPLKYRAARWDAITVHHLLSHTSGIPDYVVSRDYYHVVKGFCPPDTVDGMLKEAMGKDLEFAPGSKYSYTNLGYTLLGVIIENQAHTTYPEYIQHHILEPLGMSSSRIHIVGSAPARNEAEGLRWSDERQQHVPDEVVTLPATAPDGGLITTLGDFARWSRIFMEGKLPILSADSFRQMSTPHVRIGNGGPLDSMGYGLFVGDRLIGHGGLVVGFSSQFVFDRDTGTLIAVFCNDVNGNPQQVVFALLTLLLTGHS